MLLKRLGVLQLKIAYAPRGPIFDPNDLDTLNALLAEVKRYAKTNNLIFLRISPNIEKNRISKTSDVFKKSGFLYLNHTWTFWNAPSRVLRIDLSQFESEHQIFMSFKKNARRAIKRAIKQNITIKEGKSLDDLKKFYRLFRQFSVDRGFIARSYEYQRGLFDKYIKNDRGTFLLAYKKNQIIAGYINIYFNKFCAGMHGAYDSNFRKYNANELLEWESIKHAYLKGCWWYSFRGMGPTKSHDQFKLKFNPQIVSLAGYYDYPFIKPVYYLFYFLEFFVLPAAYPIILKARKILSD
jgi:lipid II:glycine glycyltransferase (peptidoglycan interpeptide bridge formation enzyme)